MFVRKKSLVPAVLEVWLAGLLFIIGVIAFFFAASVFVRSAFAAPFLVCDLPGERLTITALEGGEVTMSLTSDYG